MFTRPVWAEIQGRRLVENYRLLRERAAQTAGGDAAPELLAVVKANAYGHGALECAPLLTAAGARWLGVTCVEEGVRVRTVCPQGSQGARVVVMSGVWCGEAETALEHGLTSVVWEQFHLDLLEAAAAARGLPSLSVPVHLEIDTGMSRQGVRVTRQEDVAAGLEAILGRFHPGSALRLEGLMTHFRAPEVLDDAATADQMASFRLAVAAVVGRGLKPGWISAGNSATILAANHTASLQRLAAEIGARLLLRPGLTLYGYPPRFTGGVGAVGGYAPVLSWKTRVTSLRTIEAGEGVGYNATFRAARPTRLALLPLGYADGVNRLLTNRGRVLVRGRWAPIAGRVSMDQTVVDVSEIPSVAIGDEVVLIGDQGEASISAYDMADQIGTIPYEVLCAINTRVPRVVVP